MKKMNFTSVLIGTLIMLCIFLFMGQNKDDNEVGRYQVSTAVSFGENEYSWDVIYETIIDTKTGKIVKRNNRRNKHYE